jgi:hypothetical protein
LFDLFDLCLIFFLSPSHSPSLTLLFSQINTATVSTLNNLVATGAVLSPVFGSGVFEYNSNVTNIVTSVTISHTPTDTSATVRVNGAVLAAGSGLIVALNLGSNTIVVQVTAQNGIATNTYTLTINRVPCK